MRCPKCHYISFDASDRCRNCGYEFSLTVDVAALDLPIQTGDEPEGPLSDFSLTDLDTPLAQPVRTGPTPPRFEPEAVAPEPRRPRTAALDLPLFKDRAIDDDRPLVTPPVVPRPPLAVRKSTPPIARPAARRVEELELDLGPGEQEAAASPAPYDPRGEAPDEADPAPAAASLGRRAAAVTLDVLLLAGVDVAILYFTLRLCGLQFAEIGIVPVVPFLSFLLVHNGGYFVTAVTLGGQTIGKMAFNIKVVPADGWADRVTLGASVVRAAAWLLTVAPLGLGLLPALFGADHRAVHDRLAGTRVIRA